MEDKFVAISDPKTPQRIHFLWKFMPVQTNLLLTLFLDDPVPVYWKINGDVNQPTDQPTDQQGEYRAISFFES